MFRPPRAVGVYIGTTGPSESTRHCCHSSRCSAGDTRAATRVEAVALGRIEGDGRRAEGIRHRIARLDRKLAGRAASQLFG